MPAELQSTSQGQTLILTLHNPEFDLVDAPEATL